MCRKKNRKLIRSRRRCEHEKRKKIFLVSTKLQSAIGFLEDIMNEVEKDERLLYLSDNEEISLIHGFVTKMTMVHAISILQARGYKVPCFSMPVMDENSYSNNAEELTDVAIQMMYEFAGSDCFDVFEDIEHRLLDVAKDGCDYDFYKAYHGGENEKKAKQLRELYDEEEIDGEISLVIHFFRCKRLGRLMNCIKENPVLNERYGGLEKFVDICSYQMWVPFENVFTDFSETMLEKNSLDTFAAVGYSSGWEQELEIGAISPFAIAVFTVMPDVLDYLEKNIPELCHMVESEESRNAELKTA